MVLGSTRCSLALAFLALTCLPGCDENADDDSPQSGLSYSQPSRPSTAESRPTVEVVINRSPLVTSMFGSTGLVTAGTSVELQAIAEDPDGDPLVLRWSTTCPGTFDRDDTTPATFVPGTLPPETDACAFEVTVEDGRGGKATGVLMLSTVPPKIQVTDGSGAADVTALPQ